MVRLTVLASFAVLFTISIAAFILLFVGSSSPSWLSTYVRYWPLLGIVFLAGFVAYFVDLTHNPEVSERRRWLWVVAFLALWPLAMPLYFLVHVLGTVRRPRLSSATR